MFQSRIHTQNFMAYTLVSFHWRSKDKVPHERYEVTYLVFQNKHHLIIKQEFMQRKDE